LDRVAHFRLFSFFQVVVLDYKSIICPGKTFVMHLQAIIEEVTLKALICLVSTSRLLLPLAAG
jgi:translation elongation factor EF-1alpha